jgi:LL-diaminopimelate aminotransferase
LSSVPADKLKRAKTLVINYPNNPTGASATPEFFGRWWNSRRSTT